MILVTGHLKAIRRAVRDATGGRYAIEYGTRAGPEDDNLADGRSPIKLTGNMLLWLDDAQLWDTPELPKKARYNAFQLAGCPLRVGCAVLDLYLYHMEDGMPATLHGNVYLTLAPDGSVLYCGANHGAAVYAADEYAMARWREESALPDAPLALVAGWLEDHDRDAESLHCLALSQQ